MGTHGLRKKTFIGFCREQAATQNFGGVKQEEGNNIIYLEKSLVGLD